MGWPELPIECGTRTHVSAYVFSKVRVFTPSASSASSVTAALILPATLLTLLTCTSKLAQGEGLEPSEGMDTRLVNSQVRCQLRFTLEQLVHLNLGRLSLRRHTTSTKTHAFYGSSVGFHVRSSPKRNAG